MSRGPPAPQGSVPTSTAGPRLIKLRANEKLAGSADYARNLVELPSGRFTTEVARFRLDSSFSTRMFLNAFVQYNRAARTWLTNGRYRFIYRPLSDFFVVYNETRPAGLKAQRTLALKYTILMSF